MKNKGGRSKSFYLGIVFGFLITMTFFAPAYAQELPTLLSTDCRIEGNCDISEFFQLMVRAVNFLLQITGAILLITFVYGGYLLVISGGSSNLLGKAKKVFVGSIIGMILVFGGYVIINSVLGAITEGEIFADKIGQFQDLETFQDELAEQEALGCCNLGTRGCLNTISLRDCEARGGTGGHFVGRVCGIGFGGQNQCLPASSNYVSGCCEFQRQNESFYCVDGVIRGDCEQEDGFYGFYQGEACLPSGSCT